MSWESLQTRFRELSLTSSHQIGVDDESILITTDRWTIEIFPESIIIEGSNQIPDEIFVVDPEIRYHHPGTLLIDTDRGDQMKIRLQ